MWAISTTFWKPHFSSCETGGRKAREISIWCRNCSQGSYSYFTFPLCASNKFLKYWYDCNCTFWPGKFTSHNAYLKFLPSWRSSIRLTDWGQNVNKDIHNLKHCFAKGLVLTHLPTMLFLLYYSLSSWNYFLWKKEPITIKN